MNTEVSSSESIRPYVAAAPRDHHVGTATDDTEAVRRIRSALTDLGHESLSRIEREAARAVRQSEANLIAIGGDGPPARPWRLGVLPLVIAESSWRNLEAGLRQRTRVLELVIDDLLGPRRLVRDGVVPVSLLPQCESYFRAFHALVPADATDVKLHLSATDLAFDDDGFVVTGDRTRAPSGLGFAIENRILMNRLLPRSIRGDHVHRLAEFFASLRDHISGEHISGDRFGGDRGNSKRAVILTPGSNSYRYAEDAYLARYLNLTLIQGDDLTVRNERLHLRTLSGLLPVDSVWRHIDDGDCDPLELNPTSNRGASGLVNLVRRGRVRVVNAIGAGLAELPALRGYLNDACVAMTGTPLTLRSVDTVWCGDAGRLRQIQSDRDDWHYVSAMRIDGRAPVRPSELSASAKTAFYQTVAAAPHRWAAVRPVGRSSTAVFSGGQWSSQFVSLRTYQLQTGSASVDDVMVMPGGLSRISPDVHRLDSSPREGRFGLDTWIVADAPLRGSTTLLPPPGTVPAINRGGDGLPSRVAENFFWLARTIERIDMIARLIRVTLRRAVADNDPEPVTTSRLIYALASTGHLPPDVAVELYGHGRFARDRVDAVATLPDSMFDPSGPMGLWQTVQTLNEHATSIRDRISIDAYAALADMVDRLESAFENHSAGRSEDAVVLATDLIGACSRVAGLTAEVMTRTDGWRFFELGRRIERGFQVSELLRATMVPATDPAMMGDVIEVVLRATDSIMTYRSRYRTRLAIGPTLDLLINDVTNPRSIAFQIGGIVRTLKSLPATTSSPLMTADARIALKIRHRVRMFQPTRIDPGPIGSRKLERLLKSVSDQLPKLSDALSARYLIHAEASEIDARLNTGTSR